MSRSAKPGGLGWRPDQSLLAESDDTPVSLATRILSVIPFVLLGALGVIATVAWVIVLVFGAGLTRGSVWTWASGRPAGEVVSQVGLLLLIGVACAGVVVVSIYATGIGFGTEQPSWFWPLCETICLLLGAALFAARAVAPETLAELGLAGWDFSIVLGVIVYSAIIMDLRRRQAATHARRRTQEENHG